jgi:dynein heavy chain
LGGLPAGPAGTGKTETVKDLVKAVGNFCAMFNCSDAVTVIQMESFFSGLAQTGAWACFDEFNRINSEVLLLSVIAEQIYTVQQAVAAGVATFEFVGQTVPINQSSCWYIHYGESWLCRTNGITG